MDKNTPLTFGIFEDYFTKYMDNFRAYLDDRFDRRLDGLETRLKQHVSQEIDELALATKMGFDHVDERFNAVNERFNAVDNRFKAVDERFITIDEQFNKVDERFDAVDERFNAVDDRFKAVNDRFNTVDVRFDSVDNRFDSLEHNLSQQIEDLAFAAKTGFDDMDRQFAEVKQDVRSSGIEASSNRVRLQNLEARIA